ncbi:MAG: bifunctional aconitate hydratase 2/2-methylisocitrate dehydratase, partial [Deltaproteobacteria bacterium]|nr:bifunctional aconitate hydratase 2/2-methylisocitrate dehydratase [Deltaproteobacteria bacterium]
MLQAYREQAAKRAEQGIPPLPLHALQVPELVKLFSAPPKGEEAFLLDLLSNRVPAGVDDAAKVKAEYLAAVAKGTEKSPLLSRVKATELLGTMLGGFNVAPLVDLLDDAELGAVAGKQLSKTLLVFTALDDVAAKAKAGNAHAKTVLQSWADAEWFTSRPKVPEAITVTVFKVTGETNTDDLSPATDAWSRPDIPLHALAMLKNPRDGITSAIAQIEELKKKGHPLACVGDVMGTGSSRKSATNSVLWHMGDDIPFVPNKRAGGVVLGGKIAPIFFNTMEDSGALPVECDVTKLAMGDVVTVHPYAGKVTNEKGETLCSFELKTQVLLDEVQAGGRIPLIIGRSVTDRARKVLGLPPSTVFRRPVAPPDTGKGFTMAQKIVGQACGVKGIRPGTYCEPVTATVGSQDTTGPMTRDELKELACLKFSADLVMQSFCHTAAYPKKVDIETQKTLPDFIQQRGGISLRAGDGIIHSWLNRMLLPDQVGTGGDSHTRFPLGISFPAGSGLVAFAAALGIMPLDMPESVLVRFRGALQPGVTLRDLVNAIPWAALQTGDLTVAKKGKKNVFNGRIIEIEGLPNLTVEQAFELSDATAERSAAGCTIRLSKETIGEYLRSNIVLLRAMVADGYGDAAALERRAKKMEEWLANPVLLEPDADAEYAKVFEIDLDTIREPLLACPNDPDDIKKLSEVADTKIDEVFIGSCMTNIGHFRAAGTLLQKFGQPVPTRLWMAPPTRMDQD